MSSKAIYDYIEDVLKDLININTTKFSNNETEAAKYLQEQCDLMGIECTLYEPFRGKGSLVATIKGWDKDSIILYCHLDTEEFIDVDAWNFSPNQSTCYLNRIYGRGAIDCKGLAAVWMGVMKTIVQDGIIPQKTIKLIAVSDEESGGEKGLGWLSDNTDHFKNIRLVLSEGGGFPLPTNDTIYFTVQTGERERIKIKKSDYNSNALDNINKIVIDEGIEVKAFNQNTKDYLSYLISDNTSKKQRIDIKNFNNLIFDCQKEATSIYQMPFVSINSMLTEDEIIEHVKTGPIKDLSGYLEIIQTQLFKFNSKYRILPFVTPGFSDNRYFRLKGIDTIGFFPLDVNNGVSGIHGINEYITSDSIEFSYELLHQIVKNIAF
ncbi:MAG TPA: hypothetical protein DCG34_10490 [Clostridiales bacterium]|jgi:acetylornithine deacetylase/succinyl-diaminopimelate desuccinylase-like protein|nr:hypothetical protein [Clostridiales bacterium]